jgi:hypothetical protein
MIQRLVVVIVYCGDRIVINYEGRMDKMESTVVTDVTAEMVLRDLEEEKAQWAGMAWLEQQVQQVRKEIPEQRERLVRPAHKARRARMRSRLITR